MAYKAIKMVAKMPTNRKSALRVTCMKELMTKANNRSRPKILSESKNNSKKHYRNVHDIVFRLYSPFNNFYVSICKMNSLN